MRRETPDSIDRSTKNLEYLMYFMLISMFLFPVLQALALVPAAVVTFIIFRLTADKPPGFVVELSYSLGVDVAGLIPRDIRRLSR